LCLAQTLPAFLKALMRKRLEPFDEGREVVLFPPARSLRVSVFDQESLFPEGGQVSLDSSFADTHAPGNRLCTGERQALRRIPMRQDMQRHIELFTRKAELALMKQQHVGQRLVSCRSDHTEPGRDAATLEVKFVREFWDAFRPQIIRKCSASPLDTFLAVNSNGQLTVKDNRTQFVLMEETVGEALQLGWQVSARCAYDKRDGMKSVRACIHR
jgi:hypothetical protein